jgi:hypothetical protein
MAKILAITLWGNYSLPLEVVLILGAFIILAIALFIAWLITSFRYNPKFKIKKFRRAAENKSIVSFKYFTLGENGRRVYQYESFRFLANDTNDEQFDIDGERYYVNAEDVILDKGKYYFAATSPYSTVVVNYLIENIEDFRVELKHGHLKPVDSTAEYDRVDGEGEKENDVGVML